ncbi:MAG: hypothetical protein V2J89_09210 [Halieaceae bacterium]|jgi:hypothetical protein|nr:hypothetical protein [Halieaceae bacterium]
MNTLKATSALAALVSAACLSGCISSPLPAGTEAQLYGWRAFDTPLATRAGIASDEYNGYFDGDLNFSDLPLTMAVDAADPNAPYLLKSCEEDACYYAVLFSGDFSRRKDGSLAGFAALTPLSTAMYGDVRDLPANQVRPRLDALAAAVTTPQGPRDYAGFIKLDYLRAPADAAKVEQLGASDSAEAAIQAGELPSLQALLNASITTTRELQAPTDFVFSSAWDLDFSVDVSERMPGAYLALCADFATREDGSYQVNYANCRLKTPTENGRFEDTLRMSASVDELLAILIPLNDPAGSEYHRWLRAEQGDRFEVR